MLFDVKSECSKIQKEIVEWRRYIHKHAETGIELKNTVDFVCSRLSEFGVEYKRLGDYGVLGTIKGDQEGKTFALRADMDALVAHEDTGLEFQSINEGKAHLCGHDTHTAMLLGAAKVLSEHRESICGMVKLIFQPDEENGRGASRLIEDDNILEGIHAIFGIHIATPMPSGYVAYAIGPMLASAGTFNIKINGKGAHGAMPHMAVDPIVTASEIVMALQTIVSRNVDPAESAVVTVGKINGGTASNIIPAAAEIVGTLRAVTHETTKLLTEKIKQVSEGICIANGAECDIDITIETPALINPKELTEAAVASASKIVGNRLINLPKPQMGGEDFAYYMQKIPGCFVSLCAGSAEEGYPYPMHSPKVLFNEEVFCIGSAIHVQTAIDWLEKSAE